VHVTTVPGVSAFIRQFINPVCRAKVFALITHGDGEQLGFITSLIERGELKAVVDSVFPLMEVAAAQEYSKSGRAKGEIVLDLSL